MKHLIASAILLTASASFAAKPVAMDWHNGGSLYVLSKSGEVGVYDVERRHRLRTFSIESKIQAADIVSARIFNAETVFVSGFYGRQGVILQYSPEGKLLNRFTMPDLTVGLDVDPDAHVLYVACPNSRTIYSIDLAAQGPRPQLLAFIGLARTLGPVTFDAPRKQLIVGDPQSGSLFAIDCRRKSIARLTNGLGGPVALAFDKSYSSLYVADYIGGKIHVIKFPPPIRSAKAVATSLHDLSAIAPSPADDNVFIADEERGVFLLSTRTGEKSSISGW
jgi:6-phosphogluconolactonase (cycloisomerase 2 family)